MTEPTSHKMAMDWMLCPILWSRHCSIASPNTYPTRLCVDCNKICHFAAANQHLLPPNMTDIIRFRQCRVPIDYFVATWLLAANKTLPPLKSNSAMPMVLCERVRITHFIPILMLFWTNVWWAFHVHQATPVKLIYQFCLFLLQFEGPNSQKIKRLLLTKWVSLRNKYLTNIPASSHLVHCSPVLTLFCFACNSSTWYAPIYYGSSSLFNNQPEPAPIGSLYMLDGVGCVLLNNSILSRPN